jgi:shikimate kinase
VSTVQDLLKNVNLYLVGMMGSGKTTVGQLLASQLGYQFFDTDALVEQVAGQTISQIFAESGEAAFRELETQVLSEICAYKRLAIATGGGIVLARRNWSYLQHGIVVWLDVPVDLLQARLEADFSRPLLQQGDLGERLRTILAERSHLYAQADVRVTVTPEATPEEIVTQILTELPQVLKAESQVPEMN